MKKILVIISAITIMGLIAATPSYCQENETSKTKTIEGNVVSADWEKSTLTVKWLNGPGVIEYEEVTFSIPESLKISEGGDAVGLMDVETGARIIVEYYEDDKMPTAKSVTVVE